MEVGTSLLVPVIPSSEAIPAPLYRHPRKIWGIGMNYTADANELAILRKEEPVSFMKPDTSIIGDGEAIVLPAQSERVTAEAELAVIIGRTCKNITEEEARCDCWYCPRRLTQQPRTSMPAICGI